MRTFIIFIFKVLEASNASLPIKTVEEWERIMSNEKPIFIGNFDQYGSGYGQDFIATAEKFNGLFHRNYISN